ncbi:hypothetical protein [Streptomyces sp. NPDC085665]|uniref:hypothetical protein n=1 Tax=Streptomyces sp. NPDC085665 TaxID=3365735 RepID=UPI0037D63F9F
MTTNWLDEQALAACLEASGSTWRSLDERGRWLAGRQVAEWTYEHGRAQHGADLDQILERRWSVPGELRRLLARLGARVRPEDMPLGVAMFLGSQNRETEQQLERFAACWRQLRTGRPYRIIALADEELERLGRAFGEWFASRCTDLGVPPEETARRLQYGSTVGVLKRPVDGEEDGEPEALWFWAAQHCKTPAVADHFRAGMLMAMPAQPRG